MSDSLVLVLDVKVCLLYFLAMYWHFLQRTTMVMMVCDFVSQFSKVLRRVFFNMSRGFHVQLTGSSVAEVCQEACRSL